MLFRSSGSIVKMFEHQIIVVADAIKPGMLKALEDIEQMNIDESSSICSRVGISEEFAGTSRHDRKSAEPALLEKIVCIAKIDMVLELGMHCTNTIIPTWGSYHHVVIGKDEHVALRLLKTGAVVAAHAQRRADNPHDAKIFAIQIVTARIVFIDVQDNFDLIQEKGIC